MENMKGIVKTTPVFFHLILVVVFLTLASSVFAQQKTSLDQKIDAAMHGFKGKIWIYAKNLDTGKDFGLRSDEPVRTASTIKLPIMAEVYRQV